MTGNKYNRHEQWIRDGLNESAENLKNGEAVPGALSNTETLCFILGWQGGTIHQVAQELDVSNDLILNADYEVMQWLCRMAQLRGRHRPRRDPLGEALNSGDGSYRP